MAFDLYTICIAFVLLYIINKTMNKIMYGGLSMPNTADLQLCVDKCAKDYVSQQQQPPKMQSCINRCAEQFVTQHPPVSQMPQTSTAILHQQTTSQQQQQDLCATNCVKTNCLSSTNSTDRMSCANKCVAQCKSQTH